MKINDTDINYNGSSLRGYIDISFTELFDRLGPSLEGDAHKVDAEWIIQDGHVVATIYNYKDGVNYLGAPGTPTHEITDWHIGGFDSRAVDLIHAIFPNADVHRS